MELNKTFDGKYWNVRIINHGISFFTTHEHEIEIIAETLVTRKQKVALQQNKVSRNMRYKRYLMYALLFSILPLFMVVISIINGYYELINILDAVKVGLVFNIPFIVLDGLLPKTLKPYR